jgi:hypothetical protein
MEGLQHSSKMCPPRLLDTKAKKIEKETPIIKTDERSIIGKSGISG